MPYAIAHIADIHYRPKEPEGASATMNAFICDLREQMLLLPSHTFYLAITGDIVYEGADASAYDAFLHDFDTKLDAIGIPRTSRMIVPGNHDVDRTILATIFASYRTELYSHLNDEPSFNAFINTSDLPNKLFDVYQLFESDFSSYGIDYAHYGKGWTVDNTLGVYCLNTALSSFAGINAVDDKQMLAVYTRSLLQWCNNTPTSLNILLMHHPPTHLIRWSKDEVKQLMETSFSLCLCGHAHEQDIFYNKITQKCLICSAPQLFTTKNDTLGYAIILIEDNSVDKVIYRQFMKGKFYKGQRFSENDEGVIDIQSAYRKSIELLKANLANALAFFKSQPDILVKPKLSKKREFNDEENLIDQVIQNPQSTIIIAHPQFGLTCLSHYMRLEAFKNNNFWIYLDAKHVKSRNVTHLIDGELKIFNKHSDDVKCIIIDSWDSSIIDHRNILKIVDRTFAEIPILLMLRYTDITFDLSFESSTFKKDFSVLHLQALQRNSVRELACKYNAYSNIDEDTLVTTLVKHLEALNVHRTPLNCLSLLKVFEKQFNHDLVNRTKMIKALLFILFTDSDSFTYSSHKPDVDDCEYILGKFCKTLIESNDTRFSSYDFKAALVQYCNEKLISVDIDMLINILESNNILLRYEDKYEFKHSYWIFYFAANYMLQDDTFCQFILSNRNYVNYPEIIEFYTGIDGRRDIAISTLLNDLNFLVETVSKKTGIPGDFDPFQGILWNPSEDNIETIKKDITNKVMKSNLPTIIKDQHADMYYDSEAPYDQSINSFLNESSFVSLIQAVRASSRALRNSKYVDPDLKKEMVKRVLDGWQQISNIIYCLSPTLAKEGTAIYDGLRLILLGNFEGTTSDKLRTILIANPYNVVEYFKDDLSSKKIGPLIYDNIHNNKSVIQRHMLALYLIKEKPIGWFSELFEFMNLLHKNSFILGDLCSNIRNEIEKGFVTEGDGPKLTQLCHIIVAKHKYGRKKGKNKIKDIPANMVINENNKLPIDAIMTTGKMKKSHC